MGPIGAQEMFLIFVIALLLFGPKKLPELGRMLGKGLTEFRRAKNELKSTFESHMNELEKEVKLSEQEKPQWEHDYSSSSSSHPYSYDEYGHQSATTETASSSEHTSDAPAEPTHSESSTASQPVADTVPRPRPTAVAENVTPAPTEEEKHLA